MTTDKNQSNTRQTDRDTTEQVSRSNSPQYQPNWIIPEREANSGNRREDQPPNQQDTSNSTGNEETLGIP